MAQKRLGAKASCADRIRTAAGQVHSVCGPSISSFLSQNEGEGDHGCLQVGQQLGVHDAGLALKHSYGELRSRSLIERLRKPLNTRQLL